MSKRLKVLMSAFACAPDYGSEPEVGWQWALQMAKYHDVTVLARSSKRPVIEKGLTPLRGTQPLPEFVYHEEAPFLCALHENYRFIRLYYTLWHRSARKIIADLHKEKAFDLLHHVTIAGFRYATAIWNQGVPTVWGPIGGIERIPSPLQPWRYPASLLPEALREVNNFLQFEPFNMLSRRAKMTTITLVSTPETEATFRRCGIKTTLMPTIGFNASQMAVPQRKLRQGPLKILFVGKVITLKGIDLAIEAVAAAGGDATFTIVGDSKFMANARKLVWQLGIGDRVKFRGRLPAQEVLKVYADFDVFLFPSLHDTGGFALIEAMSSELPVICLDSGGPAIAVKEGAGIKVPLGTREEVVRGLASAIRHYDRNRQLLLDHGRAARQIILRDYEWDKKGPQMDAIYWRAIQIRSAECGD